MTNRARYPRESVAGFRAKGSPLLPRPSTPPLPPSSSSLLSSEQRGWRGWQIDPSRSASTITPIRHYVPPGHTYPHALNVGVRYPNASTLHVRGTLSYDTGADLPVASQAVSNKYPNLRLCPPSFRLWPAPLRLVAVLRYFSTRIGARTKGSTE